MIGGRLPSFCSYDSVGKKCDFILTGKNLKMTPSDINSHNEYTFNIIAHMYDSDGVTPKYIIP